MKIRPLNDRVIVKRLDNQTTTSSGIVIPDSAAEKPDQGEVLAVGPGRVNDQGHRLPIDIAVGDRVLQTFATSSTGTLGADVLFGRIGGEEFAALFPVGDLGEAFAVADRVRRNFAEAASRFANSDLVPTVSAGITIAVQAAPAEPKAANGNASDPKPRVDTLLEVADRALYRAKANGRNRVEATAPLEEMATPLASAPSIVPLIKTERLIAMPVRGWRRRASQ